MGYGEECSALGWTVSRACVAVAVAEVDMRVRFGVAPPTVAVTMAEAAWAKAPHGSRAFVRSRHVVQLVLSPRVHARCRMPDLAHAPASTPTQPLRVCLVLLTVNRRLSEIEDSIQGQVLRSLPLRLLDGAHGPRLGDRIDGYVRARALVDWLVEEGWPWQQDRAWARRGLRRATHRLANALVRALLAPPPTVGDIEQTGTGEAVRDPREDASQGAHALARQEPGLGAPTPARGPQRAPVRWRRWFRQLVGFVRR
jgi:hypothetical protein